MSWDVSDDPVDFDEAIDFFRAQTAITKDAYDALSAEAKAKALTIAGTADLDVIADVWKAIDAAISKGTDFKEFTDDVAGKVTAAWGGTVADPGWRLETIFRTNVQRAYSVGRYRQATDPDVKETRPFWQFDAVLDGRTSPMCKAAHGTIRPADDPWWKKHLPPLHFGCRSTHITLTDAQAQKAGGVTKRPTQMSADDGFGAPPGEEEWKPKATDYPVPLRSFVPKPAPPAPPPPPPTGIEAGKHVKKLTVGRGAKDPGILDAINDPRILKALEKAPLREVTFKKSAAIGRRRVNGFYVITSGDLTVGTTRSPGSWGHPLTPGSLWSVSYAGADEKAAAARTFTHELGHHLHFKGRPAVDAEVKAAFGDPTSRPFTEYAGHSAEEYFAESFAAYRYHPAELKAHDPRGFAMVEKVLHLWGK